MSVRPALLLALALLAGPPVPALAHQTSRQAPQQTPPPATRPQAPPRNPGLSQFQRIERAVASLNVDEATRAALEAILDGARTDLRRLRGGLRSLTADERQKAVADLHRDVVAELKAALAPEQHAAFDRALRQRNPQPAGQGEASPGQQLLRELLRAVEMVGLTDEQRPKVDELTTALRRDLREIVQAGNEVPAKARARVRAFREELATVLTPEQRASLQEALDSLQAPATQPADMMMGGGGGEMADMMGRTTQPGQLDPGGLEGEPEVAAEDVVGPADSRFLDRLQTLPGLAVDAALPETLNVLSMTNRPVAFASLLDEHRPTVVLLGSASSPTFRDRVGDLPWLLDHLKDGTGRTAKVVVLYTREQYPTEEWALARNAADGFNLADPKTADERVAVANNLRRWGGLGGGSDRAFAMAVDAMDDAALVALTGSTTAVGNHVFVFRPDGTLTARRQWFDPTGIAELVAEAAKAE